MQNASSSPGDAASVRGRATAAAGTFALGGIAGQIIAFLGNLVVARFLSPHDFGLIAFGSTVIGSVQVVADGGLGLALIRQPGAIERSQLEAVMGFQVAAGAALAAIVGVAVVWFGTAGIVTAVMVSAVPIIAWRSAGSVRVEREIRYRPIVIVALVEVIGYYVWSIAGVAVGWGVWALATGAIFRALAGTVCQQWLLRDYKVRPRLRWAPIKPLMSFGANYLALATASVAGDQGLNFGISATGGFSMLGLWSFASRLLQPINLLYSTLWRVTYPTMSRLMELREDPMPVVSRIASSIAILTSIVFVPLVICSHALVTIVFGARWADVSEIFPGVCLGLLVGGPVSTALTGYLWAIGEVRTTRNALIAQFGVSVAVTLPLVWIIGPWGLGVGAAVASLADAAVLLWAARGSARVVLSRLAVPGLSALVASLPLWLVGLLLHLSAPYELAAAAAGALLYVGLVATFDREALTGTFRTARRAALTALRPDASPSPLGA